MNEVTSPGRLLFKAAVPDKYKNDVENLDKKKLHALLLRVTEEDPEAYVDILQNIGKVSADAVTYYGGPASISLSDFKLSLALEKLRDKHKRDIAKITSDPRLSDKAKKDAIVKYILPEMKKVQDALKDMPEDNALIKQLKTGAKGNPSQVMQLLYGDMMVVDSNGNPIPIAGLKGYGEGAGTKEYWAGSYGSRMGYASVQFGTGESGYFGKLLTQGAHRVVVTEKDCGAKDAGVKRDGSDPYNIGSVLIRPVAGLEAGHAITKEDMPKLRNKDVYVRSATTCQAKEGVCSKCAGKRETGDFPAIGDAVGITAARAVAEPTTQMALSAKHSGGVAGQDERKLSGFKEVSQFVNVPKNFQGGATLAERDGIVTNVKKAPQGGNYVMVSDESHYVPQGVGLKVKAGDRVLAGDVLSNGVPNPAEIVRHKGIGEGREYFTNAYTSMLADNGVPVHRRNIEALSRGLINRVRITRPEGYAGHYMDDVVPYDDLVRDYQPRKGFLIKTPVGSKGMYLEKPALHHTIGTRVTKKVVDDLSKAGIKSIVVHKDEPFFQPVMPRVMDISSTDSDWKTRLGGFNLKKSFLNAANKGAVSEKGGTSYIPTVIEGGSLFSKHTEKQ